MPSQAKPGDLVWLLGLQGLSALTQPYLQPSSASPPCVTVGKCFPFTKAWFPHLLKWGSCCQPHPRLRALTTLAPQSCTVLPSPASSSPTPPRPPSAPQSLQTLSRLPPLAPAGAFASADLAPQSSRPTWLHSLALSDPLPPSHLPVLVILTCQNFMNMPYPFSLLGLHLSCFLPALVRSLALVPQI